MSHTFLKAVCLVGALFVAGCSAPVADAQKAPIADVSGWTADALSYPSGTAYTRRAGPASHKVQVFPVAALREANGQFPAAPKGKEDIEAALSIVSIDVDTLLGEGEAEGQFMLWGNAYTGDGERAFLSKFQGQGDARAFVVFTANAAEFSTLAVKEITFAQWPLKAAAATPKQTPKIAKAAPPAAKRAANTARYALPVKAAGASAPNGWVKDAKRDIWYARANDKNSPLTAGIVTAGSASVKPETVAKKLLAEYNIKGFRPRDFQEVKSVKQWLGYRSYAAVSPGKLNGRPAVAFFYVTPNNKNKKSAASMLIADAETWKAWGGVTAAMTNSGLIGSDTVIPASERSKIAKASLSAQRNLYVHAYDTQMNNYGKGIMATQTGTLNMMMGLNYDMILGNEINPTPVQ